MRASRGMGCINPSKMPKAKIIRRKDNPDEVTTFKEGGDVTEYKPMESDYNIKVVGGGEGDKQGVGGGGRLSVSKTFGKDKDWDVEAYVEGNAYKPQKGGVSGNVTGGGLSFTKRFAKGGKVSKVNEAGNYTKPGMRKSLFNSIKAGGKGGAPGQWSARKAQLLASQYKKRGGGYRD